MDIDVVASSPTEMAPELSAVVVISKNHDVTLQHSHFSKAPSRPLGQGTSKPACTKVRMHGEMVQKSAAAIVARQDCTAQALFGERDLPKLDRAGDV